MQISFSSSNSSSIYKPFFFFFWSDSIFIMTVGNFLSPELPLPISLWNLLSSFRFSFVTFNIRVHLGFFTFTLASFHIILHYFNIRIVLCWPRGAPSGWILCACDCPYHPLDHFLTFHNSQGFQDHFVLRCPRPSIGHFNNQELWFLLVENDELCYLKLRSEQ